ncbi:MAG TPA: hypothetical protein DCG54_09725 [Anaerolineae bacterium]|jgi:hypothetical protein|nr:hypothetical protein [Anaerolineae bacterium]
MFQQGDLARIKSDVGFALVLPDGRRLVLHGQLVKVLDIKNYTIMGLRSTSIVFQPYPWGFEPDAYPSSWEASERYFEPCDSATAAKTEK